LIEICYYAIKYSNDYREGKLVDESAFYNLIVANKSYSEEREKLNISKETNVYSFLQCLANVQFDFQYMPVKADFNRMYHILININQNPKFIQDESICYINFNSKFKDITGMEYEKFTAISVCLVAVASISKNTNIYDIINNIQLNMLLSFGFLKCDFEKVIELLYRDYEFYKESNNWNVLRYYPIVKTNERKPKYLISNIYALYLSLPSVGYWIIRNYYADLGKNDFNIYFGKCFEFYLKELFEYYKIKAEYIEEIKDKKTPDWKVETGKFIFLIEQKTSLFQINARSTTDEENIEKLEEYVERSIVKALKQLDWFEIETEKPVIRICLTFEKIYIEENIKLIALEKQNFNNDKDLMWIVNIDEFEILMQILNTDEIRFNKIIEEKINLEKTKDKNGRALSKLLGEIKNTYAEDILRHFDNVGENFEKL